MAVRERLRAPCVLLVHRMSSVCRLSPVQCTLLAHRYVCVWSCGRVLADVLCRYCVFVLSAFVCSYSVLSFGIACIAIVPCCGLSMLSRLCSVFYACSLGAVFCNWRNVCSISFSGSGCCWYGVWPCLVLHAVAIQPVYII